MTSASSHDDRPVAQRLVGIRDAWALNSASIDADALAGRVAELEGEMQEPGFWDDPQAASKISAEHSRVSRRLAAFRELERDVEDLDGLAELAEEDPDLRPELEEALASMEARLATMEEERLFSGPYDQGDALVTVNAGAGGTDAQDWAEMVLRMEMRWAEKRGFKVDLLEASAGE